MQQGPANQFFAAFFEKIAERRPLYQITPLTDRLNYCSSPINNMGWHTTCEKLLGIKTPKRVDYLRVIIMELARIADHLICNSVIGVDTGAFTGFLYVMQYRELIYEIWEEVCGSRLTTNIGRIGGFERNFNDIAFTDAMYQLERWYNIEVVYEKGVPPTNVELSGKITKDVTLNDLVTILEKIGLKCKLEGRKLLIQS